MLQLTDSGRFDPVSQPRWEVTVTNKNLRCRWYSGERLTGWDPTACPVVALDDRVPQDMPWPDWNPMIVSERLRDVIVSIDPGAAQFLPLSIDTPRGRLDNYFGVQWLHVIDCIDQDRTWFSDGEHRVVYDLVIDPSKIPPDVHLCRPLGWEVVVVVRGSVRRAFLKNRIVGPQFMPTSYLGKG